MKRVAAIVLGLVSSLECASAQEEPLLRFSVDGEQERSFFAEVVYVGDLDDDDVPDFAVGADRWDVDPGDVNENTGRVTFHSGATGEPIFVDSEQLVLVGNAPNDQFGKEMRTIPDLNGDGYKELVIAAPSPGNADDPHYVRIYSGLSLADGCPSYCQIEPPANAQQEQGDFGTNLADAGDVDEDGVRDLLVGRGGANGKVIGAYLYSGAEIASHLDNETFTEALFLLQSTNSTGVQVDGLAVSGFRDVDGDGAADFLVGEYHVNGEKGRVTLYSGGSDPGDVLAQLDGTIANAALGYELQPFTVDGTTFVAIGAPAGSHGTVDDNVPGRVLAYSVVADTSPNPPHPYKFVKKKTLTGDVGAIFGIMISAGDFDGNGSDDLAVAARYFSLDPDPSPSREGRVFVYEATLSGTALDLLEQYHVTGHAPHDEIGRIAFERDVTDDGRADLLLGTGHVEIDLDSDSDPEVQVGRAYLVTYSTSAASVLYGHNPVPGSSGVEPSISILPAPIIGLETTVRVGNTYVNGSGVPQATDALLWIGTGKASNPCATIQVTDYVEHVFSFASGQAAYDYVDQLDLDSALVGMHLYLQAFVVDPGADGNLAISQGLDLTLGMGVPW
jgi:hypothetical protein